MRTPKGDEEPMSDDYHPTRVRGVTAVKVQRARELRRDMTPEERILWQALRRFRSRGYAFRRQQIISGFIADFYCHPARLVVEVDGGIHAQQPDYDTERDAIIAAHGLRILRIPNADIQHNLPAVLARITELLTPRSEGEPHSCLPFPAHGEGAGG